MHSCTGAQVGYIDLKYAFFTKAQRAFAEKLQGTVTFFFAHSIEDWLIVTCAPSIDSGYVAVVINVADHIQALLLSLFLLPFLFIFSHISKERQTNITLDSYPWFPMHSRLCSSYVAVVVNIADCMNYSSLFLYHLSSVFLNFYSNLYPHLHNDNTNCTKMT